MLHLLNDDIIFKRIRSDLVSFLFTQLLYLKIISVESVPGEVGQTTFIIPGQFSIITIDNKPAVYTPDLNVEGSDARESLLIRIRPLVNIRK